LSGDSEKRSKSSAGSGRRRLWLVAAVVLLAAGAAVRHVIISSAQPERRPRHGLLIVVDALRADRLGCYGYTREIEGRERSLTPNIDRLAGEGALFERCYSQSSWTGTSMASMLYSVNPTVHTDYHSYDYLEPLGPGHSLFGMVGEVNVGRAYDKVNVQTNPFVLDSLFTSLFDRIVNAVPHHFRERPDALPGPTERYANAAEVNSYALEAADRALEKGRSFLLYLHYMDVHEPYVWRMRYRRLFDDGAKGPANYAILRRDAPKFYRPDEPPGSRYPEEFARKLEHLSNDYDASLMYLDDRLGGLFRALERRGVLDDTMLVLAADHGQEFGEHGNVGHGSALTPEQVHVPLIISGGGMPAGVRVATRVANLDIMPTLSEYVGLSPHAEGRGLAPLAAKAASAELSEARAVFACADFTPTVIEDRMKLMVISPGGLKYVATRDREGNLIREELYDLTDDPGEWRNLAAAVAEPAASAGTSGGSRQGRPALASAEGADPATAGETSNARVHEPGAAAGVARPGAEEPGASRRDGLEDMRALLAKVYSREGLRDDRGRASMPPLVRSRLRALGYLH